MVLEDMLKSRQGQGGNPEPRKAGSCSHSKRGGGGGREEGRLGRPRSFCGNLDHGWTAEPVQRPQEEGALERKRLWPGMPVTQRGGLRVGEKHTLASLLLPLKVFHLWHPLAPAGDPCGHVILVSQVTKQRFAQMAAVGKSLFC